MNRIAELAGAMLDLVIEARRGVLVTVGPDDLPRPVPFCYVARVDPTGRLVMHTPIDEKPKRSDDPLTLARVRDIARRPEIVVLVDRWDEDWTRLAWVRLQGVATVLPAGDAGTNTERAAAIDDLRLKHSQYATHALEERPLIRIVIDSWSGWSATPGS
ncbi:MAG TPA: pyridoxamine 5'-phosphate oxidase family protein [Candidatus Acidoferrum sp.]|jgi:PPOX class probable F420-dependent enzyme|nr:pyridoxamine 5'-phosphate oxidase family protein [Candidatus Acidoferrum sp.]